MRPYAGWSLPVKMQLLTDFALTLILTIILKTKKFSCHCEAGVLKIQSFSHTPKPDVAIFPWHNSKYAIIIDSGD
jgi:hypothetical protein